MAPPIPVYNRSEVRHQYRKQLELPAEYECSLRSITQHECTFRAFEDRSRRPEILCLPFKRVFQRCLVPQMVKEDGHKTMVKRWVNIEVTDASTNRSLVQGTTYKDEVRDFMNAERDFRKLMEMDADGNL